ncbi:hypothetical protein ACFLZM_03740 [Thermodesulfobacteriota bacterium]
MTYKINFHNVNRFMVIGLLIKKSGEAVAIHLIKKSTKLSLLVPFFIIINISAMVLFVNDAAIACYPIEEKENSKKIGLLDEEISKEIKFYGCTQYLNFFTCFHIKKFDKNVYSNIKNPLKLIFNSLLIPRSPPTFHCSLI